MESSLNHLIAWSESTRGEIPHPLTGPSITISPLPAPHPPTIFLFGGKFVHTRRLTNELWSLDLTTRVWERVDTGMGPGPRYFHSMDTWEDKLVCFGGMSDSEPTSVYGDIWFFDCSRRRWHPQPSPEAPISQDPRLLPSARYAHLSAVSRGQLVISGGQHENNTWIYEINVYDLKRKIWTSRTEQPEAQGLHSKGAYRSVATSSKQRVITPPKDGSNLSYAIEEEGEGGQIWCYSNYDFAKVRRELDVFTPSDSQVHPSHKHQSPPSHSIEDISQRMSGSSQPPGLRFPTGGIIGNHFILCGLYLASTSAAYSVYALNLDTLVWRHLEPAVLNTGSWNRAVIWPEKAKLLVFGNNQLDLSEDYGRRAVNLDNIAIVSLETYGIYAPPKLEIAPKIQEVGLTMFDEQLASDFEVVCDDGRRIKCSRAILSERWPWFAQQERELRQRTTSITRDAPVDINDTLLGTFNPARLHPTHINIPEPFPVCVAFVQYFYTLSLSTPLQHRAPVLSALLFLAKQYKIPRLASLVLHALHERLDTTNAVGIYEIATLGALQNLQVRALSMIHAAKNSATSRSHRQPPASAHAGESNPATSPPASSTSQMHSPSGSSAAGHTPSAVGGAHFRRARTESITIPLDTEDDFSVAVPSRYDVASPVSQAEVANSPIRRMPPLSLPPPSRGLPFPPSSSAFTPSHSRRPSGTTDSSFDYSYPVTPSEPIRESALFPTSPPTMGSRSNSLRRLGRFNPLGTLLEDDKDSKQKKRNLTMNSRSSTDLLSLATLQSALMPLSSTRNSTSTSDNVDTTRLPPRAYSAQQSLIINTISPPYDHHPFSPSSLNRFSHNTHSSWSSGSISAMSETPRTPHTAAHTDFASDHFSPLGLERVETGFTSIASSGSGSTGTWSRKADKAEKKAIKAAEVAAKKADQQARFEALRLEQAKAQALAKAEMQRKAEVKAHAKLASPTKDSFSLEGSPVKPVKQSKMGKFGAKFAESVLFPSGGGNSTMF